MGFKVNEQCFFDLKIKGHDTWNFVDRLTLLRFIIQEEVGNILPTFEADFLIDESNMLDNQGKDSGTSKLDLLKFFNEGNILLSTIGDGQENGSKIDTQLFITSTAFSYEISPYTRVYLHGIAVDNKYNVSQKQRIIYNKTSIDAIKEIFKGSTDFDLKIKGSASPKDTQNWIQYNIDNKSFVCNILQHSYISDDDFYCYGISMDKTFTIANYKTILAQKVKYSFSNNNPKKEDNVLPYSGLIIGQESSIINDYVGYEPEGNLYNAETGVKSLINVTLKNKLSLNNKLNRSSRMGKNIIDSNLINENVHPKYWSAYYNNMGNLLMQGVTTLALSFSDKVAPDLKVLDLVNVSVNSIELSESGNQVKSNEYISGKYVITKIVRCVTDSSVVSTIYCNREALNSQSGSFK